jgi:hypothetical protein
MLLKRFSFTNHNNSSSSNSPNNTTRSRRGSSLAPPPPSPAHNNNNNNADTTTHAAAAIPDPDFLQSAITKKMSEIMDEKVRTSVRLHKEANTKTDEVVMLAQQVRTLKEQLGRQSTLLLDYESIELTKSRESLYQRIQAPPNFWVEETTLNCPDSFFDPSLALFAAESSRTTALHQTLKHFFEETSTNSQDISQTPQRTSFLARQARGNTEVAKLLSIARSLSFSVVDFHDTSGFALYGGVRPSITLTFSGLTPTIQHAVGFIQWSSSVSSWSSESSASVGSLLLVMCAALENQEQRQFIYGALVDLETVQIYKMEKIENTPLNNHNNRNLTFKTTAYLQTSMKNSNKRNNGKNPLARMLLTDPETLGFEISLPLLTKSPPSALTWLKSFHHKVATTTTSSSGGVNERAALSSASSIHNNDHIMSEEKEDDEPENSVNKPTTVTTTATTTSTTNPRVKELGTLIYELDLSPPNLAPLAIYHDSAFFAIAKHPDYVIKTYKSVDCAEMRREIQALERIRDLNLAQVFECVPALLDIGPNFILLSSMDRLVQFHGNLSFHLLREPLLALKHIHGLGLVHRCIAPENLLVSFQGNNNKPRIFIANWNWSGLINESVMVNIGPGLRFSSDDVLLAALHNAETTFSGRDDIVSLARIAAWVCDLSREGGGVINSNMEQQGGNKFTSQHQHHNHAGGSDILPSVKASPAEILRFWDKVMVSFGIAELYKAASKGQYDEMLKLFERVKLN